MRVKEVVAAAAPVPRLNERVVVPPAVTVALLKLPVTPAGSPETERATLGAEDERAVVCTV